MTEMKQMHEIQLEMFKELQKVMQQLNISYYMVHGSLLGTIRDHNFIAEDDDIDIAIFRSDYDKLMEHGNEIISKMYFIQSSINDEYPLPFAKVRKNDTAFMQPVLERYQCHKGIYIDIFPIDYMPDKSNRLFALKNKLLTQRIYSKMPKTINKKNIKQILLQFLSQCCYPTLMGALKKREALYRSIPKAETVCIFGGKSSEKNMPIEWFNTGIECPFCDTVAQCPKNHQAYLERIYGTDYINHNPAIARIEGKEVEVSAEIIDFTQSYQIYCKK